MAYNLHELRRKYDCYIYKWYDTQVFRPVGTVIIKGLGYAYYGEAYGCGCIYKVYEIPPGVGEGLGSGIKIAEDQWLKCQFPVKQSLLPIATVTAPASYTIGVDCFIGNDVVIGNNVQIGCKCHICTGVVIGDHSFLAPCSKIGANAVIKSCSNIEGQIGAGRTGVTKSVCLNRWGITGHTSSDGLIIVIGDMNSFQGLPYDEAYGQGKYVNALALIKEWYDDSH